MTHATYVLDTILYYDIAFVDDADSSHAAINGATSTVSRCSSPSDERFWYNRIMSHNNSKN